MRIIRKTSILVKTKRALKVRGQASDDEIILCPQCGEIMSDARSVSDILDISVREVYRLVEAGKIHFFETGKKIDFLCLKSILDNPEIN